jgi:glycosyltransferase involved in cell wall biosynthesis
VTPIRVLAFSPVPYEGAGCRFRIAQYAPYLASQGIELTIAPFYDRAFFELVYRRGHYARKTMLFLKQTAARLASLVRTARYDAILIYRETFPVGPPLFEALLRVLGRPLVYDFDDAVFLPNTSRANRYIGLLKFPQKTGWIIAHTDEVVAGNEYLADFARRHHASVHVIPTSVDTQLFVPAPHRRPAAVRPVVGWIGTPTTARYLDALGEPLRALSREYEFVLRVSGAGSRVSLPGVTVETPEWTLEREVELFNTCDVGVYPLFDDQWSRGKCGFKAIQFMACGVPVVASPVGVNREIIEEGVNGFFAATPAEWREKIGRLLGDQELRRSVGDAARRTIEQRYSLQVNAPRVAAVIRQAIAGSGRRVPEPVPSAAGDSR